MEGPLLCLSRIGLTTGRDTEARQVVGHVLGLSAKVSRVGGAFISL